MCRVYHLYEEAPRESKPEVRMGVSTHKENGSYAEPNVIPMIDILLVLIIIFMILAMRFKSFHVNVPMFDAHGANNGPSIVLTLTDENTFEINGQQIEGDSLKAEITEIFTDRPNKLLFIDAGRNRSYQEVIHAFSLARSAGAEVLALMPRKN